MRLNTIIIMCGGGLSLRAFACAEQLSSAKDITLIANIPRKIPVPDFEQIKKLADLRVIEPPKFDEAFLLPVKKDYKKNTKPFYRELKKYSKFND